MTKVQFEQETFGFPLKGEVGFEQDFFKKRTKFDRRTLEIKSMMKKESFVNGKYKRDTDPLLLKLWKKSKNIEDFYKLVKEDEQARLTQFAGYMFKNDWYFLRSLIGDKKHTLYADAGSVKFGTDDFSFLVSSGGGDGKVRFAVFEDEKEFNDRAFKFSTTINGKFNVYQYDCGEEILMQLEGKYFVYKNNGFVCLVKSRN